MILFRKYIKYDEFGLVYKNGKLIDLVSEGWRWFFSFRSKVKVEVVSQRSPWIDSVEIDQLARSVLLNDKAKFIDLKDNERALVWVDNRFEKIVGPGLYGLWTKFRKVDVTVIKTDALQLKRQDLETILKNVSANVFLNITDIPDGKVGVLYVNGEFTEILPSGKNAFWKDAAKVKIYLVDQREQIMDISGQEIMTQDKVTMRLNALLTYRITDPQKSVDKVMDIAQALYREAQLTLRSEVGTRVLDGLLADKEDLAKYTKRNIDAVAKGFGVEIIALGIRDIILPGDMKELMNKVMEAQKASEANVIKRREETAAMRSQMNTAKLIEANPVLMKLRELEVLETVAKTSKLNVVLGEQGLTDRITKLI